MLKNKFKIIALLLVLTIAILTPIVRADNETNVEQTTTAETANAEEVVGNSTTEETFKKSDVYLVGENVTIDYVVDGNLFVMAQSVTIKSQIGGDAFIMAKSITVEKEGYIYSNLFAMAQEINIQGVVYDIYALAQNADISGYVYRDLRLATSSLSMSGVIGRNAFIECENMTFGQEGTLENGESAITSQALINGNLSYSAPNEVSIPDGVVSGETKYIQLNTNNEEKSFDIQDKIFSLGVLIVTVVVLWFILSWLSPKLVTRSTELITKKTFPVLGIGILTPIIGIIGIIFLLSFGITVSIAFIALFLLISLMLIATSVFIIAINNIICDKLKIEKTIGILGMLILSSIVLWLVKLIPFVGSIVGAIAFIAGLGIIISNFIFKDLDKKEEKIKTKKADKEDK